MKTLAVAGLIATLVMAGTVSAIDAATRARQPNEKLVALLKELAR